MTPWISVVRMAPERLPLSPEWEARALELRQDWSRVTRQVEALARRLQTGGRGVRVTGPGGGSADREEARQAADVTEIDHDGRASETSRLSSE
jgi:hypothetical protein